MSRLIFAVATLVSFSASAVDFVREVQPIFREHCYGCHGARKQEAAFRLDHKKSALDGGDFGLAIKPGHAEESLLVHALEGKDPKKKMPRKGESLSEREITLIKSWIREGAPWPDSASVQLEKKVDHWAFQKPVKPKLPEAFAHLHPIDAFIQQRLVKEGLKPGSLAPYEKRVRRLYLDLVGLPPTPEQIKRGLEWSALVNELLSSPHYGERWGRHWLDAAHYADSNGYEKDPQRFIWFYRDWVIQAMNRDLPYDQFIIEQIAGDQLPQASQDQIVATGFLRNSMINEEGGVDPEQFRMEAMFDRMDTVGKSVLGLTIGCTQCHNHKYDPISQEEYYRMFAFLNNDNEPWRVVYTSTELQKRAEVLMNVKKQEEALREQYPDWKAKMEKWVASLRGGQPQWGVLKFKDDPSGGEKALRQPDGSILAQGYAPTKSDVKFEVVKAPFETVQAFRLELMNDPNLPAYGPGRSQKGTAALTEFRVQLSRAGKQQDLKFQSATADFGEPEQTPLVDFARDKEGEKDKRVTGPVSYAIDGKADTAWGINAGPGRRNVPRNAVFVLAEPMHMQPGDTLTVVLSMKHGGWNSDDLQTMNLGRYRVSATDARDAKADPLPPRLRARVEAEPDLNDSLAAALFPFFRAAQPEWARVNEEIEKVWKNHPEGTTSLVLDARDQPRATRLLKRGDFLKPGELVKAGVPAVLNPLPKDADGSRLTFARWLVSPEAPTTARAFVNRVWQAYFGLGLVETPEDFGTQGARPSHPELLDWLAADFMEHGWSMKRLHHLIVTSHTYQQDSVFSKSATEKDPVNRLLARGPRFRVEGEIVRDIQLSVSGLLNPQVGGRGVMPPAPDYLFQKPVSYAPFPWRVEADNQKYRRSVYVFRRRSTPYPFLSTFDVPNGEASCLKRARSNTPLQALMTLNETLSLEAAQHLAKRMSAHANEDAAVLSYGFELCTGRVPSVKEVSILEKLLRDERQSASAEKLEPMVVVARALLNLDETITKE